MTTILVRYCRRSNADGGDPSKWIQDVRSASSFIPSPPTCRGPVILRHEPLNLPAPVENCSPEQESYHVSELAEDGALHHPRASGGAQPAVRRGPWAIPLGCPRKGTPDPLGDPPRPKRLRISERPSRVTAPPAGTPRAAYAPRLRAFCTPRASARFRLFPHCPAIPKGSELVSGDSLVRPKCGFRAHSARVGATTRPAFGSTWDHESDRAWSQGAHSAPRRERRGAKGSPQADAGGLGRSPI